MLSTKLRKYAPECGFEPELREYDSFTRLVLRSCGYLGEAISAKAMKSAKWTGPALLTHGFPSEA